MKTVTVRMNDTELSVDTLGAQLRSFKKGETEYLWQRDPKIWSGSAPILFPIVGELKGEGKTTLIDGKPYHMPIHGFAGSSEFEVTETSDHSVLMTLKANEDTKKQYPFDFRLGVLFEITEHGFRQTFIVTNESSREMPFVIGAHPGFRVPLFGDHFENYTVSFEFPESAPCYRIDEDGLVNDSVKEQVFSKDGTLQMTHALFEKGAVLFDSLKSRRVSLLNREGRGVAMDFPGFDFFGIWQMAGTNAEYVCLEPWTGMNDCYSEDGVYTHKKGIKVLKPGAEEKLSFTVTVQ